MAQPIRGFQDLEVYQEAVNLATRVYALAQELPDTEKYALSSQLRRAAISVLANIAEGYGKKRSTKDFRAYLDVAIGSSNEVIALLDVSEKLGFFSREKAGDVSEAYLVLAKRITALGENWH